MISYNAKRAGEAPLLHLFEGGKAAQRGLHRSDRPARSTGSNPIRGSAASRRSSPTGHRLQEPSGAAIKRADRRALEQGEAYSTLAALKAFFQWLCREPGFKRLSYSDADYFSLSLKDCAIAKARNEERVPTLEQIRHVLASMPADSDIEKRNRALIALVTMTGARVDAGRVDAAQACRPCRRKRLSGREKSGPDEVFEVVPELFLPVGERHTRDFCRNG